MKKILLLLATIFMLLFATAAQANLVSNGDFSNGLDDWAVSGSVAWAPIEAVKLDIPYFTTDGTNSIRQSFSVAPGTEYLNISFELTFKGYNWDQIAKGVSQVVYSTLNSESFWFLPSDWDNYDVNTWSIGGDQYHTVAVDALVELNWAYLAQNPEASISFTLDNTMFKDLHIFLLDSTFMLLDNVSITAAGAPAVPIPGAVWLMGTGLAGLVALRRKIV